MNRTQLVNEAKKLLTKAVIKELIKQTSSTKLRKILDTVAIQEDVKYRKAYIDLEEVVIEGTAEMIRDIREEAMREVSNGLFKAYVELND